MRFETDFFQAVRVVDVVVLGPIMLRIGKRVRGPVGTFLALAGIATIVFNGINFLDTETAK